MKLEGYEIYQFIQDDYRYIMETEELDFNQVTYSFCKREMKTWFGLGKKTVNDLLIFPKKGFYYPYQFGNYFYLFTRRPLNETKFKKWLNEQFIDQIANFDDTFAGMNTQTIQLMNDDDYLLVTNHDHQEQFGITGTFKVTELLRDKLKRMGQGEFEEEEYIHSEFK